MTTISTNILAIIRTKLTHSFRLYRIWWKDITLGAYIRILTLIGILFAAFTNPLFPDINDMNQLLTLGIFYMFQGRNPYGQTYVLTALGATPRDIYSQNFLNYGPVNLLLHLPPMVYPWPIYGAGFMELQPSFMIWHAFFDFLMFDRLMRMRHRFPALLIWLNPFMVMFNLVTHMSVPLFLLLMGYEKWKDPVQSMFWLGLGALTYQYIALILLFALVYHLRSYRQVLFGLLPSFVVLGVFQAWAMAEGRPLALINDLLLVQLLRGYEPWIPNHTYSWYTWTGSIPAVVFNIYNLFFSGNPDPKSWLDPLQTIFGPVVRLSLVMNILSLGIAILLLLDLVRRPNYRRSLLYGMVAILLVLLSSPSGIWHHNFIVLFPLFFVAAKYGRAFWRKPELTPPI